MLGIALTLFAVFLVICFALCYSDRPSGRGSGTDAFFYIKPKDLSKNRDRTDRADPRHTDPIANRPS
jgi:hypothetical protein